MQLKSLEDLAQNLSLFLYDFCMATHFSVVFGA